MKGYVLSVIRNEKRGVFPFLLKCALLPASLMYSIAIQIRYALYDAGMFGKYRPRAKVISVGNITAGGTGKTPVCRMLAEKLAGAGLKVLILSRGYGKTSVGSDDEAYDALPPNVVRIADPKRDSALRKFERSNHVDVIILDDGFQHVSIERDLDIVLVDCIEPFSNGHLLPLGLLRERLNSLKRADIVILTRANQVSETRVRAARQKVALFVPEERVLTATITPEAFVSAPAGAVHELSLTAGKNVLAFCGIGNPESFRRSLEEAGAKVVKFVAFPDHHRFTDNEMTNISALASEFLCEFTVTTEKDFRRVPAEHISKNLLMLRCSLKICSGADMLDKKLRDIASAKAQHSRSEI